MIMIFFGDTCSICIENEVPCEEPQCVECIKGIYSEKNAAV